MLMDVNLDTRTKRSPFLKMELGAARAPDNFRIHFTR
jgi:hypothetical protein